MDDRGGGANGLRTIVLLTSSVAADVYEIEEEPTGRIVRSTILFFNNLRLSLVTFNPGVRYRKSRPMEAAGRARRSTKAQIVKNSKEKRTTSLSPMARR